MPIDRDGDGPPLRRAPSKVSLTPGEGRSSDLRATPFTEEVFDDDYYGRRPRRVVEGSRSISVIVGVVLGIAVAGGAGYYFLRGSGVALTPGELAFVKAEPSPYKIRPESPGGMQVENQDKLVYDRVAKGNAPARVENLLPAAEEPKAPPMKPKEEPKPEPAPAPAAAKVEAPKVEEKPAPEPVKEPEVAKAEAPAATGKPVQLTPQAPAAPAKPEADPLAAAVAAATGNRPSATGPISTAPAPVAEAPKAAPAHVEPPKPVQTATATPAAGGAYQIQLASVLSEQAALAEWGRISGKNKDILGGYAPTVVRADLGEKGVFYRLRAGPLADKAAADSVCASLAAANVGCIVVKP